MLQFIIIYFANIQVLARQIWEIWIGINSQETPLWVSVFVSYNYSTLFWLLFIKFFCLVEVDSFGVSGKLLLFTLDPDQMLTMHQAFFLVSSDSFITPFCYNQDALSLDRRSHGKYWLKEWKVVWVEILSSEQRNGSTLLSIFPVKKIYELGEVFYEEISFASKSDTKLWHTILCMLH